MSTCKKSDPLQQQSQATDLKGFIFHSYDPFFWPLLCNSSFKDVIQKQASRSKKDHK